MRIRLFVIGITATVCAAMASAAGLLQQKPASDAPAKLEVAPSAPAKPDEPGVKAVRELLAAFAKGYNAADVPAMVAMFTDDASVIDSDGEEIRGKAAIAKMYADAFADASGVKLEARLDGIRLITPDVARVEGRSRISSANGDANDFHRFNALLVRKGDQWRIAEIRDYPMPVEDVSPYERLKELEWMVGEWVDEDADNKVSANIVWADNQSYLVRTYTVELQGQKATSGTMFIGWDPQTGQIKSWLFDSEGGHGEGLWTRTGTDRWVVKAQGVLRDGRSTSATQIHTIVNKDAVKTSSVDRILGGQAAPDVPEILMVRKPPQPKVNDDAKPNTAAGASK